MCRTSVALALLAALSAIVTPAASQRGRGGGDAARGDQAGRADKEDSEKAEWMDDSEKAVWRRWCASLEDKKEDWRDANKTGDEADDEGRWDKADDWDNVSGRIDKEEQEVDRADNETAAEWDDKRWRKKCREVLSDDGRGRHGRDGKKPGCDKRHNIVDGVMELSVANVSVFVGDARALAAIRGAVAQVAQVEAANVTVSLDVGGRRLSAARPQPQEGTGVVAAAYEIRLARARNASDVAAAMRGTPDGDLLQVLRGHAEAQGLGRASISAARRVAVVVAESSEGRAAEEDEEDEEPMAFHVGVFLQDEEDDVLEDESIGLLSTRSSRPAFEEEPVAEEDDEEAGRQRRLLFLLAGGLAGLAAVLLCSAALALALRRRRLQRARRQAQGDGGKAGDGEGPVSTHKVAEDGLSVNAV